MQADHEILEESHLQGQPVKVRAKYLGGYQGDGPYLDAFLKTCNRRNPGLNARAAKNFDHMLDMFLNDAGARGGPPKRFLCYNGSGHYTAWECKRFASGQTSAICLETVGGKREGGELVFNENLVRTGENLLASLAKQPDAGIRAMVIATGVQKTATGCGALSEGFLKSFHKNPDHYAALHEHNRSMGADQNAAKTWSFMGIARSLGLSRETDKAGNLGKILGNPDIQEGPVSFFADPKKVFQLVTPDTLKNAESRQLLKAYFEEVPTARQAPINKKGETIEGRLQRMAGVDPDFPLEDFNQAQMANGKDTKQLRMYGKTMKDFENRPAEGG